MPRFRLRHGAIDIELPPGDFLVGRSAECELLLDDHLVSRRHALFRSMETQLLLEDLGSRNGVKVNGNPVDGVVTLREGDLVTIGSQQLRVNVINAPARKSVRMNAVTQPITVSDSATGVALRAGLIDKALAAGNLQDAEIVLTSVLHTAIYHAQGPIDPTAFTEVTSYALRLCEATGRARWIDEIFRAHHRASRVIAAPVLDELHVLARKLGHAPSAPLREYLAWLRERTPTLTAGERFVVQRLEGLVRTLSA